MSDLLLDVPWWLFLSLAIIGGIVGYTGVTKRQKGSMYAGLLLILMALSLKAVSYFVETDKQICARQTAELVTCVQKRDWATFDSLLEDDVVLGTSAAPLVTGHRQLVDAAKEDTDRYKLTGVSARVSNVQQDATGVIVDINASSDQTVLPGMSATVPSGWKLTWEKVGRQWMLHEITCTKIGNSGAGEMARYLKP
jgi:hypothetical protein